jgi:hypothetical protein
MDAIWKDATSYRQGKRGKQEPTSWERIFDSGDRIWISRSHLSHPESWVMNVLDEKHVFLGESSISADSAKAIALLKAHDLIKTKIQALHGLHKEIFLARGLSAMQKRSALISAEIRTD